MIKNVHFNVDIYNNAIPLIFYLAIYKHDNDKGYWKKQQTEERGI